MAIEYHLDKEEFESSIKERQTEHKGPIPPRIIGELIFGQTQFKNKGVMIPGEDASGMIIEAKGILNLMGYEERDNGYSLIHN